MRATALCLLLTMAACGVSSDDDDSGVVVNAAERASDPLVTICWFTSSRGGFTIHCDVAPDAVGDSLTVAADTAGSLDVLTNDRDRDGDRLTILALTPPSHGHATFAGNTVTYTPDHGFRGTDNFWYVETDGVLPGLAQVTVTVLPANVAPVAVDDTLVTDEDTSATVDVLANDIDVDGDALTVTAMTTPWHGMAALARRRGVHTGADYNGDDSFKYTISDGTRTSTAAVSVTVTSVNDPPIAVDDALDTAEDTSGTVDVLANDLDLDGDPLTVTAVSSPAHGTRRSTRGGVVTYTPAANYHGPDSFTYTVSDGAAERHGDGHGDVASVDDAPVAVDDTLGDRRGHLGHGRRAGQRPRRRRRRADDHRGVGGRRTATRHRRRRGHLHAGARLSRRRQRSRTRSPTVR